MLTLQNVSVSVGNKEILHSISHSFQKGKIHVLVGPNGSGKSTLAYAVMGHPRYITKGKIFFNKKLISSLPTHERALRGVFITHQVPLPLSGVSLLQLIRATQNNVKEILAVRNQVEKFATELRIDPSLLQRSLHEGASGGERKKLEVLQAFCFPTEFIIFDEVDTGVDVDELKRIFTFIKKHLAGKTALFITHNPRFSKYLKPHTVSVMEGGRLIKTGGQEILINMANRGFQK